MNAKRFASELDSIHPAVRVAALSERRFLPEDFHGILDQLAAEWRGLVSVRGIGRSFEGRPLRLVSVGKGSTKVLLWSQMHGDEPTATMAIADILNYLAGGRGAEPANRILSSLTLHLVPILNPDGAARIHRRTAQGIDMNRDARALVTPEARVLQGIQQELRPAFGFNLHDQELSTIGSTREVTAFALLAPAIDEAKTDNAVCAKAKRLAGLIAAVVSQHALGRVARYDDTFEPRAFGDSMQQWGTSTVLIESGHAIGDPQKESIRRLNFVAILSALHGIAAGEVEKADAGEYESLPLNGKRAYDVIVRNALIDHGEGRSTRADLGISYQVDTHPEDPPRLVDLGDLSTFVGLREVDGGLKGVPQKLLSLGKPFDWERWFT